MEKLESLKKIKDTVPEKKIKLKQEEIDFLQEYAKKLDEDNVVKEQQGNDAVLDLKNTDKDNFKKTNFKQSQKPVVDLRSPELNNYETKEKPQAEKVEEEKVYEVVDCRGKEYAQEFKKGDKIFLNGRGCVFGGIAGSGALILDGGEFEFDPLICVITKTEQGFNEYNMSLITKTKGIVKCKNGEINFTQGDKIFFNGIERIFEGITEEGDLILDGGEPFSRHNTVSVITKTKQEYDDYMKQGNKKIEKENAWVMELSENQAEQEKIKKLFEYSLKRAHRVDIYESIGDKALKQIAINQTKELYNKYKA